MKAVLAGGTGNLGRRIADDIARQDFEVVVLTRKPRSELSHRQVLWDGRTVGPWSAELDGAVIVNLAGELVDRRPTTRAIELLTRSRVEPTRALAMAAGTRDQPPKLWLQMSTLAIYGDAGEAVLDESAAPADGPAQMAGVAREWEDAAEDVATERQVILRTGVVFDRDTPALNRLTGLARWGLGGRIAAGRQWVSWLHIQDFLAIVRRALVDPDLSGVVHATSPNPVRNAELMRAVRQLAHRRVGLATPAALVHVGARLLGTDPALALTSRRCIPGRLLNAGFQFGHPEISEALSDLFGP